MINIKNFTLSYNGKKIFNNLNLNLNKGDFLIVCGSSGCGKSTLLHAINRIIPDYINAKVSGRIESSENSIVFQNPHIISFANSVIEELSFELENKNIEPDIIFNRIMEISNICGIDQLLSEKISKLSAGQKEKVALTSAIMSNQEILLFDEPLPVLDEKGKENIIREINELCKSGKICIVAEHFIKNFLSIATHILFIFNEEYLFFQKPFRKDDIIFLEQKGVRVKELDKLNMQNYNSAIPVVKASDLTFRYNNKKAIFKNCSITIHKGNFIGLTGSNGCGKTTLLKLLAGIIKPVQGKINIKGNIAYIDQNPDSMLFESSVLKEILSFDNDRENIMEIMELLNIFHLKDRNPLSLSIGEKHRVVFAAALKRKADIILIDEPAVGLDLFNLHQVFDILCDWAYNKNKTVITASNDYELIRCYCNKIFRLSNEMIYEDL